METLHKVATQLPKGVLNARRLNSFGGDAQVEVAAELDNRSHQHRSVVIGFHAHGKRAIDLDLVDRELLQLRQ